MQEPPAPVELPEYSMGLYSRRHEAVVVPPAEVQLGKWQPLPNECHLNVSTWCKYMKEYTPVRGWLYFDFLGLLPHVLFNAHSVVRDPEGMLWDITPSISSQPYPFLVALESPEKYAMLVEGGISRILHRKVPDAGNNAA